MPITEHSATDAHAHAYARVRGCSPGLYAVMRTLTVLVLRLWFRIRVEGTEHVPAAGPAIVAPNHKNFLDPFFIGIATRRHVRYMAKAELMRGPVGWFFLRLGAFPVRRGGADAEAMETARAILAGGGLVVVFPEGTRVETSDALGSPHHGAGRLALDTGAPIIPAAISGTSHLWRGALPRLKRVQIAFLTAVVPDPSHGPDEVSQLIDERVWPAVRQEYGRLRAAPGLIAAVLAALGLGGGLLARRRREARQQIRVLGRIESRQLRHRKNRSRLLARLRRPR
ncbi:MAG TPA: lysophospholipid acyltransferase family protein [Solirubrobacteraceae bacterium]|nr:lysophospholipid acyltransferase family protein [Solirubrobacteraceae bacterium]